MDDAASIDAQIVAAIRRISRAVDLNSRQLFESFGLTLPQLAVLREAARQPEAAIGDLARALRLSQPTVTGILDRLERRGLVTRRRSARDRRTVHVAPTTEGSRLLLQVRSPLQDRLQEGLARLKDWERTMLLASLQRIASMIDVGPVRGTLSGETVDALAMAPFAVDEAIPDSAVPNAENE